MKFATRNVELALIRLDGGTQVREKVDPAWVAELAALYRDGHEIAPIEVVLDDAGVFWMADGFQRHAAMLAAGFSGGVARVRTGSLDLAMYIASAANKHGLPRAEGDKKRAILLALRTSDGKKMGIRELARHCGVSVAYTQRIVEGEVSPRGQSGITTTNTTASPRAVLNARIVAALHESPDRPVAELAAEIGCHEDSIRARRTALGLAKPQRAKRVLPPEHKVAFERAIDLLKRAPDRTSSSVAEEVGLHPSTVGKLRKDAGIPIRPRGPAPKETPPSAPPRKRDDPRDKADVIILRPRKGADPAVAALLTSADALTSEQRVVFAAAFRKRWPEAFEGADTEEEAAAQ